LGNQADYVAFLDQVTSSDAAGSGAGPAALSKEEVAEFKQLLHRLERLASTAAQLNVPLLIDAEQSYYQDAISFLALALMKRFNRSSSPQPIVIYNTYQMYLKRALPSLQDDLQRAEREGFRFGAKLVRGAYMVSEAARAQSLGVPSPIHDTIDHTHAAYNAAVSCMLDHVQAGRAAVVVASHNEDSITMTANQLVTRGMSPSDPRVEFAQLYGMCDHASLALAQKGFRVSKYVPFGPVRDVMPYLIRRMQENRGFVGRTQAERQLMRSELDRRRVWLGPF
jgi:proline dehydrogenase